MKKAKLQRELGGKTAAPAPRSSQSLASAESRVAAEKKSQHSRSAPQRKYFTLAVCLLLAGLSWMVFGQTLRHEFVNYDDAQYVFENPHVLAGLTVKGFVWAFTETLSANWHPLTALSHMLDGELYGLKAGGHHFTNVLLHTIAAILLFLVLKQMTFAPWQSAFAALLFAIHPLRVESVAWVAERKDVLSGVFFMLTLGAYVRFVRNPKSISRYVTVVFMFALGLMSKPTLVTLPFVLLLLDYWPLNRLRSRDTSRINPNMLKGLLLEKVPLLILSGVSCVATILAQKTVIVPMASLPFAVRLCNAITAYATYLGQLIWPVKLSPFYPISPDLNVLKIAASVGLLLGLSGMILFLARRRSYLLTGWLWYLGMLVPMIGLVQVGEQAHADRYTYLPQIGLSILIVWGMADLLGKWRYGKILLVATATAIVLMLALNARVQTAHWRNSESLWRHAIASTSNNHIAHANLGHALIDLGRPDEAIPNYQAVLKAMPGDADAFYNLGYAQFKSGRVEAAVVNWEKALGLDPRHASAHKNLGFALMSTGRTNEALAHWEKTVGINPTDVGAHLNLALTFSRLGQPDRAMTHYKRIVEVEPGHSQAHYQLGLALFRNRRFEESVEHWQKVVLLEPGRADVHDYLGQAFFQLGRVADAITHWRKSIALNPQSPSARNNLAWVRATNPAAPLRDGNEAVRLAEQSNQLTGGKSPEVLDTLAAAYAEVGRFSDAVATAKHALALALEQNGTEMADKLRGEITVYESGQPYRDHSAVEVSARPKP